MSPLSPSNILILMLLHENTCLWRAPPSPSHLLFLLYKNITQVHRRHSSPVETAGVRMKIAVTFLLLQLVCFASTEKTITDEKSSLSDIHTVLRQLSVSLAKQKDQMETVQRELQGTVLCQVSREANHCCFTRVPMSQQLMKISLFMSCSKQERTAGAKGRGSQAQATAARYTHTQTHKHL